LLPIEDYRTANYKLTIGLQTALQLTADVFTEKRLSYVD